MRFALLLPLLLALGCGQKDSSPTGSTPPPTKPDPVVKTWKLHSADALLFKANFPNGDPMIRPVFFGNQPKGVVEGWDYSVSVYPQGKGPDAHTFGIRAARFRPGAKAADREEALDILTKLLPPAGWTKSEPKTVTWAGQTATETTWSEAGKPAKLIERHFTVDAGVFVGYVRDLGGLPSAEVDKFFEEFQLIAK